MKSSPRAADLAVALAWTSTAVSLLPAGARWHWALELTTHFRVQLAVGLAVLTLLLLALKRKKAALVPFLAAVGHTALVLPDLWPARRDPGVVGTPFKVASINLLTSNDTPAAARAYIDAEKPDVLLLIELSARLSGALALHDLGYEWFAHSLREDNFGIGVYARHPAKAEILPLPGAAAEAGVLRTLINGSLLTVVGIHPIPPGTRARTARRDEALRAAAAFAAREAKSPERPHVVLAGDFNATPWSPIFGEVEAASGLSSTHRGFGAGVTWWPPGLPLFAIPIDHLLTTPGLAVLERRVGPDLGSDHRPLTVTLAPKLGKKPAESSATP